MRRLFSAVLAVTVLGSWLISSSADAGPFQRLFWRLRSQPVSQPAAVETDSYRRYSYEPGTDFVAPPRATYSRRAPAQPTWMLPKSDARRYE